MQHSMTIFAFKYMLGYIVLLLLVLQLAGRAVESVVQTIT